MYVSAGKSTTVFILKCHHLMMSFSLNTVRASILIEADSVVGAFGERLRVQFFCCNYRRSKRSRVPSFPASREISHRAPPVSDCERGDEPRDKKSASPHHAECRIARILHKGPRSRRIHSRFLQLVRVCKHRSTPSGLLIPRLPVLRSSDPVRMLPQSGSFRPGNLQDAG